MTQANCKIFFDNPYSLNSQTRDQTMCVVLGLESSHPIFFDSLMSELKSTYDPYSISQLEELWRVFRIENEHWHGL